jgi:hypothetical protein
MPGPGELPQVLDTLLTTLAQAHERIDPFHADAPRHLSGPCYVCNEIGRILNSPILARRSGVLSDWFLVPEVGARDG